MYKIQSSVNKVKTLTLIETAMIEFDFFTPHLFGFIGIINWDKESFWIVNQSSIFQTRRGHRFRTYRRFEGCVHGSNNKTIIEGEFRTRPLYKISTLIFILLLITMGLLGVISAVDILDKMKIASVSILMILSAIGVMKFNIYKTQESEEEIISFIEDVLNKVSDN